MSAKGYAGEKRPATLQFMSMVSSEPCEAGISTCSIFQARELKPGEVWKALPY